MSGALEADAPAVDKPRGIWIGVAANALGLASGAVFFLAHHGDRFRGTELLATLSTCLGIAGFALGVLFGLPTSLYDVFKRRCLLWGVAGALLALTPLPLSNLVSNLAASLIGFSFE